MFSNSELIPAAQSFYYYTRPFLHYRSGHELFEPKFSVPIKDDQWFFPRRLIDISRKTFCRRLPVYTNLTCRSNFLTGTVSILGVICWKIQNVSIFRYLTFKYGTIVSNVPPSAGLANESLFFHKDSSKIGGYFGGQRFPLTFLEENIVRSLNWEYINFKGTKVLPLLYTLAWIVSMASFSICLHVFCSI